MSLLLDALKRAEQEKSARQAAMPANDAPLRHAPAAAPANASAAHGSAKPTLELQPIAQPQRAPEAARAEAREAAAAMMQAKAPPLRAGRGNAAIVWAVAGALLLLVGAGVAYVWYAMQPVRAPAQLSERKRTAVPPTTTAPATAPAMPAPLAPGMPATITPVTPAAGATPDLARLTLAPAPAPAPAFEPKPADGAAARPRDAADAQQVMADLLKDAGTGVPPPVRFSRSERAATVSPEVRSAYAALNAGDLNVARHSYAAALSADPSNVDALLGIATVEARLANRDAARAYYRKVLEIDPRNATALAGLAATTEALAPDALETQLRGELARAPDSAQLHFTLGGLYAAQSRWSEAQAQYFESFRLDPQAADTAYNLAVSLDHLGQSRLAAQYYKRALDAARDRMVRFDAAAARRRLAELAP